MQPLSDAEVKVALSAADVAGWQLDPAGGEIFRQFKFKDFATALDFVNRVGRAAEEAGHHPAIKIDYNRVRLSLITHEAAGLTPKDFQLAAATNRLFEPFG